VSSVSSWSKKRTLQTCVALGGLVPVSVGTWGVLSDLGAQGDGLASHERYLSGLLLAIGLAFWTTISNIEGKTGRFRLLTALVVVGGISRLLGVALGDTLSWPVGGALAMELLVAPLLCLWQGGVGPLTMLASVCGRSETPGRQQIERPPRHYGATAIHLQPRFFSVTVSVFGVAERFGDHIKAYAGQRDHRFVDVGRTSFTLSSMPPATIEKGRYRQRRPRVGDQQERGARQEQGIGDDRAGDRGLDQHVLPGRQRGEHVCLQPTDQVEQVCIWARSR